MMPELFSTPYEPLLLSYQQMTSEGERPNYLNVCHRFYADSKVFTDKVAAELGVEVVAHSELNEDVPIMGFKLSVDPVCRITRIANWI